MIITHSIVLAAVFINSIPQYAYMNLVNIILNIFLMTTIVYLIIYQGLNLKNT